MREYTHISDAVELAKDKAEYDTPLKHILANKDVLAWIASRSAKELKGYPATTREVKEGIRSMCNWSEGIIERAVDENTEKHILSLMELSNVSFEEACRLLNVDPEYYAELMFDIDERP